MGFSPSLLTFTLFSVAYAANNWNLPCLSGSCSHDLLATDNGPSGTVKIWGEKHAISDITPAAGWKILDCDPDMLSQEIRLVCLDDTNGQCTHLYDGPGPVDKLVRLPENCGSAPFARVAGAWVSKDQSLPADIAIRAVNKDGERPEVKALQLDNNFAAADTSKTGIIHFALEGASFPGAEEAPIDGPAETPQRRGRVFGRLEKDNLASRAINSVLPRVWPFTNPNNIPFPSLDIDKHPLRYQSKFDLVDAKPPNPCLNMSASLKEDGDMDIKATVSVKASAVGTFYPPKITSFKAVAVTTGDIDGTIRLKANVAGSVESKLKRIGREIGTPGFNYPGILAVGPYLALDAYVKRTSLDLNVDLDVGVKYHFSGAVAFPYDRSKSPQTFKPTDTPLKLSLSPSVKSTGNVEVHLIPSVNLGITAFVDYVKADLFEEFDTSVTMNLDLKESSTTNGFGGCVEMDTAIISSVGSEGDFFGLFDPSKKYPLENKKYLLYKKCFANGTGGKRESFDIPSNLVREASETAASQTLTCPKANMGAPQSVVNEVIKASDIKRM